MPGLVGRVIRNKLAIGQEISRARDLLVYDQSYKNDTLFCDENISATRTHLQVIGEYDSPHNSGSLYCWIEGEVYNLGEVAQKFNIEAASFAEILLKAYSLDMLEQVLNGIDGLFVAVIYDKNNLTIHLISDRYGMKPLYVLDRDPLFGWSSEVKAFLAFSDFSPEINRDALHCFMDIGHMVGNITWFDHVELLSASSIITYSIPAQKITQRKRYWHWSDIKPNTISFSDAVIITGELIKKAAPTYINPGERIGISLSGGLDSRTILASIDNPSAVQAFTYGVKNCWDIRIAKKVTQIRKVPHTALVLNSANWLDGRIRDVWQTDGMVNLMHLHASRYLPEIKKKLDINLNGVFGDGIRGFYLELLHNRFINCRISEESASLLYGRYIQYDDVNDPFYDINSTDAFIFNARIRRFFNGGSINHGQLIEQRYPLLNNKVVEFVYSISDHFKVNGKLYHTMLLSTFPELFKRIPWQRDGFPIDLEAPKHRITFHRLKNLHIRLGLLPYRQSYTDSHTWIREEKTRTLFSKILNPHTSIYRDFVDEDYAEKFLKPHLEDKGNHADEICRAVTMELWLNYVFRKEKITAE